MDITALHYTIGEEVDENRENLLSYLEDNANSDIVVGPETSTTGILRSSDFMEKNAERLDEETVPLAQSIVNDNDFTALFGVAERQNGKIYNSCVLLQPDTEPRTYRQIQHDHSYCWQSGFGDYYEIFETEYGDLAPAICADVTDERIRSEWRKNEPDVIAVPANWDQPGLVNEWKEISSDIDSIFAYSNIETDLEQQEFRIEGPSSIIVDSQVLDQTFNPGSINASLPF